MNNVTSSLGFRLILASFLVVAVFIFIAGVTVFKISQDSIKVGVVEMAKNMADDVRRELAREADIDAVADALMVTKIQKSGSVWLMDENGFLLYHPDPLYREEYIKRKKTLGNVVVSLQYASPRAPGQGIYKAKFIDIIKQYEEGFGTYQQYGEERVIAFQVLKDKKWLIGVDEPVATAYSELYHIRKYILYTGVISAVLIMVFTLLAIRIIVKPYYREVEDLNVRLQMSNRQLVEANAQLEASNKKLTTLHQISINMQETLALKDILDLIVSGAQEVTEADRINIMLADRDETILECLAAVGAGDRPLSEIKVPLTSKGGALAAVYKRGQLIRVENGEHVPPNLRLQAPYSEDPFLRSSSFVVLPMVVKNRSVGVIAVDNKFSREPITDDMVDLIQIFANQAAVAVENARLYEDLKKNIEELDTRLDQLSIVNQISNTMQVMIRKNEMLAFIMRGIRECMGFDALITCLVDKEEMIRAEAGVGLDEDDLGAIAVPLGEVDNALGDVISRGIPVSYITRKDIGFIRALSETVTSAGLKETPNKLEEGARMAVTLIPLRVLEDVAGAMAVARYSEKTPFITKKEMELLMLFANTAGLAIERAEFYERVHEKTEGLDISDPVTKLFIYKYGKQRVREELIRTRDTKRPLTIAMLGIDDFKAYNDRCGQELGDKAMGTVGSTLRKILSENDLAFRYAGRLLCCVFPGKKLADSLDALEELRQTIGDHPFMGTGSKADQSLTVSIGAYEYKEEDGLETPSDIFKMAIARLHRAEAAGGNLVVSKD